MKKTLIASAVAAATVSTSSFAMDTASDIAARLDSMPQVYGNIQLAWAHHDVDPGGSENTGLIDNGSTVGFKHQHEIMPGVTGFLKMELEGIGADDKAGSGGIDALDEAYIGVKGDFGQVWAGSDDSQYESLIDVIANHYEYASQSIGRTIEINDFEYAVYDTGEGDLIQYNSPSMGGLTLHGAVKVGADSDYPYQFGVQYSMDAITVAAAMDSNDGDGTLNGNTYGVRAEFSADMFSVSGQYQTRDDVGDVFGVMAIATMGPNQFAASYEMFDADDDSEKSTITLQALHNVSEHMYIWVEGYLSNVEAGPSDVDMSDLALGAAYAF